MSDSHQPGLLKLPFDGILVNFQKLSSVIIKIRLTKSIYIIPILYIYNQYQFTMREGEYMPLEFTTFVFCPFPSSKLKMNRKFRMYCSATNNINDIRMDKQKSVMVKRNVIT